MLKKKPHVESRKKAVEKQLTERKEMLKSKGMSADRIQRDSMVRKYQAKVRQARRQLDVIAKSKELEARKAETKAQKMAAAEEAPAKSKKSAPDPGKKQAKKEKKKAAAAQAPKAKKK
jgi:hypothetical protein